MAGVSFPHKLVLNRYFLNLFGAKKFDRLADHLKDESLEGRREDGTSKYSHALIDILPTGSPLTADMLQDYDDNILRHTATINRKRSSRIEWKYFQYLSLLFAEHYLDLYFRDADALLGDLNEFLEPFNEKLAGWGEKPKDLLPAFTPQSLRKLAFWNATGSGKTLLMHVNILQYQHYLKKMGRVHDLNRIVVLTPNERLTIQHLDEFRIAGMPAAQFDKNRTVLPGEIDVIDMNKLRDEGRKKTVSVDQFESNNLVLIDEGHRGAAGDVWSDMRRRLASDGFTFEYSATLGQAAAGTKALTDEYARSILFDYSYRFFYADGFGKDYAILNIDDEAGTPRTDDKRRLYLTACLLSYYQQLRLFEEKGAEYRAFLLEKPLWIFVGGKVTAVRTVGGRKISDVVDILLFLSEFVKDRNKSIEHLETLMSGDTGLLDVTNHDIFREAFPYLDRTGDDAEKLFVDILGRLFNSPVDGSLHIDRLKGGEEELGLRIGDHDHFGVVSVGDIPKVADLCRANGMEVSERDFSGSLFQNINDGSSTLNVLIGSKKFSEGWNSYRVSTMGLMHIGKSEGSEIIQLFGRGVRLKGYENSLKRSRAIHWTTKDEEFLWVPKDKDLPLLETLNVFGVQADYMAQFDAFLEDEGIPKPGDIRRIDVPVTLSLPSNPLITVRVPEGINFKKDRKATLATPPPNFLPRGRITLDWYPRVQAKGSKGVRFSRHTVAPNEDKLRAVHIAFLDMTAIFFEIERLKAERNWHNLNLSKAAISDLLSDPSWYTLYIPEEHMEVGDFSRVAEWYEIAVALLKKYCDRFYRTEKDAYEAPHREYAELGSDDPNFIEAHKFSVHESEDRLIERIEELKNQIEDGVLTDFDINGIGESIVFDQHLYQPLVHLKKGGDSDLIMVSPVHLNEGERDFVCDLREFHRADPSIIDGKEVYLLRNQSKGKGVGFFEAGNFFPDFILWIVDGDEQTIVFIDPKGIRNCEGLTDLKIRFHQTVKEIEERMRKADLAWADKVKLESFIISNTPLADVRWWTGGFGEDTIDFTDHHILFQQEDRNNYIENIFHRVLN